MRERGHTEAIERDAGVVDYNVDSIRVLFLEIVTELLDTLCLGDIEQVELDVGETTLRGESFGTRKLLIFQQVVDRFFAALFVASSEVDKEGAAVERGLRILEGEVANDGEANTLQKVSDASCSAE